MTGRFRKSLRLRKRAEFLAVQRSGSAVHSSRFVVISARGRGRVGITVSKKVGNAVIRNRIKRLVREFVRTQTDWVPVDRDVVIVAKRSAQGAGLVDVTADLERLRGRLP